VCHPGRMHLRAGIQKQAITQFWIPPACQWWFLWKRLMPTDIGATTSNRFGGQGYFCLPIACSLQTKIPE